MNPTPSEFGKVAVLMGGFDGERDISLASGQAVLKALQSQGINAHGIDVQPDIVEQLTSLAPDRAFVALHGTWGEGGGMQGILDMLAIPYTGSGITASAIAMDKPQCKRIWQVLDLPTLDFQLITPTTNPQTVIQQLGLPLCIKPVQTGSSLGVQRVTHIDQFLPAYQQAQQHAPHVIAEPWIDGEEYTVGIIGDQVLPSIRIQADRGADGDSFYDFHAKYQAGTTAYHCPSGLSADDEAALQGLCLRAYQAIGCRHWGRVDLMRDRAGQFWLLEVNTVPGMTETSLVPKAAKAVGVSFEGLVVRLLGMTV